MSAPGEVEVHGNYSMHLGPRFESAGLSVQFHYNQTPGVHFKVESPKEYRAAIIRVIEQGMAERFPDFPKTGSIWITQITAHEVDSSERGFYRAARMVIDQAYSLAQTAQT